MVRVAGAPGDVIPGIENVASAIDPLLPIAEFRTFDDLRRLSVSSERFQATLLASLSGLALVLAIVGIYGLMSQSVVERTRELGIRMALGHRFSIHSRSHSSRRDAGAGGVAQDACWRDCPPKSSPIWYGA